MHELSLIQKIIPIIEQVANEHGFKKVDEAVLKLGKLRQCVPEFLEFAFEVAAKNTVAEGASLTVELVPIVMLCENCQKEFEVQDKIYICPKCDGINLKILSGNEFVLERISGCGC